MDIERLRNILQDYEPRSYSGRGMYGKYCLAVTTKRGESTSFVLSNILANCDIEETTELLNSVKIDNMGLGFVLYWPHILIEE